MLTKISCYIVFKKSETARDQYIYLKLQIKQKMVSLAGKNL